MSPRDRELTGREASALRGLAQAVQDHHLRRMGVRVSSPATQLDETGVEQQRFARECQPAVLELSPLEWRDLLFKLDTIRRAPR